jgi:hypothetical protein
MDSEISICLAHVLYGGTTHHRLKPEPVIPRECVAGDEASQHIVTTDHPDCTNNEQLHVISIVEASPRT